MKGEPCCLSTHGGRKHGLPFLSMHTVLYQIFESLLILQPRLCDMHIPVLVILKQGMNPGVRYLHSMCTSPMDWLLCRASCTVAFKVVESLQPVWSAIVSANIPSGLAAWGICIYTCIHVHVYGHMYSMCETCTSQPVALWYTCTALLRVLCTANMCLHWGLSALQTCSCWGLSALHICVFYFVICITVNMYMYFVYLSGMDPCRLNWKLKWSSHLWLVLGGMPKAKIAQWMHIMFRPYSIPSPLLPVLVRIWNLDVKNENIHLCSKILGVWLPGIASKIKGSKPHCL